MAIKLNGVTKNNGGTVRYNSTKYPKLVRFNGSEVWKAETVLFPDGISWGTKGANAGSCSVTSTELIAKSNTGNTNGRVVSAVTIDASQFSKLTFVVTSASKAGNAGVWVGTTTNSNGVSTNSNMTAYTAVNGAGTYTADISSLTDRQYVQVACWGSTGNASCTVTSVIAE